MTVAVLVFDGVRLLDTAGPLEVFDVAAGMGVPYRPVLCSPDGGDVSTSSGLRLGVTASAAELGELDTLLVPGGECLVTERPPGALVESITALSARARRICAVCAGAFALAEAGLLEGRRVTTHWRHTDTLARRYPGVSVDTDAIYVRDGAVLTSAGVSAGIDLTLALVEEDAGDEVAHAVARDLVVFMRRFGEQPQLSVPARTVRSRHRTLATLCDEIAADPAVDHSSAALADRVGLSVRHLSRLFRDQVGCTPSEYVASVRLEAAVAFLRAGETVTSAARRSGFGSARTLSRRLRSARLRPDPPGR